MSLQYGCGSRLLTPLGTIRFELKSARVWRRTHTHTHTMYTKKQRMQRTNTDTESRTGDFQESNSSAVQFSGFSGAKVKLVAGDQTLDRSGSQTHLPFQLLKNLALLALKGVHHYWMVVDFCFFQGGKSKWKFPQFCLFSTKTVLPEGALRVPGFSLEALELFVDGDYGSRLGDQVRQRQQAFGTKGPAREVSLCEEGERLVELARNE